MLDGVKCSGSEDDIEQCIHNEWNVNINDCDHTQDIAIECDRWIPDSNLL